MKIFVKFLLWTTGICAVLYIAVCTFFYFYQEHLLFPATKVAAGYQFNFPVNNIRYSIKTADGNTLDGYLFNAKNPKGLIFYLHGNGGNLQDWRNAVVNYTNLGYDAFIFDYPGYGKSTGHLTSLDQFFAAIKTVYDTIKQIYPENHIIIMGYSMGTGPAAWLAAHNNPKMLLMLAPYYSLGDIATRDYPFLPEFILKYPINTYQYIQHVKAPIVIFHGVGDEVIYYGSSLKLKPYLKPGDRLITLNGQGHMNFDANKVYLDELKRILL